MEAYLKTAGSEQGEDAAPTASTAAPAVAVAGAAIARDPAAAEKARGYLDALGGRRNIQTVTACAVTRLRVTVRDAKAVDERSEEHTSELQSRRDLVCRLL